MENTHNFIIPRTNLIGVGSIKDLPTELLGYKLKKVLIVTDMNIIKFGYVEMVEKILKNLFISYDIFHGIEHPNATISFVKAGFQYEDNFKLLKRDYSMIITIGGGTVHDCGKAIAVLITNGGSLEDYEGYNKIPKPILPVIAINTTAGSGSDVSMFSIITDESRKVKMVIGSPTMAPTISVNDPMFMVTMPKEVTASSGIDVVSHAIEAFTSTEAYPVTDSLALKALELVFKYLPRAYGNGNDLQAREQMMFAANMAGMAFSNAGLGYTHSIAHQLGGLYNQTHGCYNAVLLPYVFEFNAKSIPEERILKIAEMMDIKTHSPAKAVDKIMDGIQKLASTLEIPKTLKEMGLQKEDIDQISENAVKDITALTNPRQGTKDDIISIIKKVQ
ncbi:MAG: iron-containing alcohol dehydrogenase [Clostridiaceae bacterium]